MKIPPKNYDNKLSRRKQDLDQIAKNESDIAALQELPVLPTPAVGDLGKVVKVGSDGYELASDAGAKLVVATVMADGQGNLSCDKTYAELSASIANGDIVELVYTYQTFVFSGIDFAGIHFALATNDSNGHNVITAWTISSSNVITFLIEGMNSELPAYSSADEGKFLGVDANGHVVWDNVPSELPAVTSADVGKVLSVDNNSNIVWDTTKDNKTIYLLTRSATDLYYDYPSGITGADIYDEFVSGGDIELRIVHSSLGVVIVRPSVHKENAIYFTGLLYDPSASAFKTVRCTVDNLDSETMTRPWFAQI